MKTPANAVPGRLWMLLLPLTAGWTLVTPLSPPLRLFAISLSVFAIVKFESERHYLATTATRPGWMDRLSWYLFWVGLDPNAFFERRHDIPRPTISEWVWASLKTLFGVLVLFVVAPRCLASHEMVAGWMAMIGLIFMLHFGQFHLLALAWRRAGRNVAPIMQAPILSTSLNEFWSRRWNLAFRDFAHTFVFRPLARRRQVRLAEWACFAFSGAIHELAISVPAGAGYGLPFAYFMWQGVGVWLERRSPASMRGGVLGWCCTALFTIPAAYWLFHPAFVRRLILPLIGG